MQDFYRQGGQYIEKEIDFGKPVGDETLADCQRFFIFLAPAGTKRKCM